MLPVQHVADLDLIPDATLLHPLLNLPRAIIGYLVRRHHLHALGFLTVNLGLPVRIDLRRRGLRRLILPAEDLIGKPLVGRLGFASPLPQRLDAALGAAALWRWRRRLGFGFLLRRLLFTFIFADLGFLAVAFEIVVFRFEKFVESVPLAGICPGAIFGHLHNSGGLRPQLGEGARLRRARRAILLRASIRTLSRSFI
jgi:hypothetical protein